MATPPRRAPEESAPHLADASYPAAHWPLGRLLSTAARLVEHDWNVVLARHELTHAGLVVLMALESGPLTQRELAAASRVEQQTMTRVLARLERTGHVQRSRDATDRRRRIVSLTDAGRAAVQTVARSDLAERLVADRVSDPELFRDELVRLLQPPTGADSASGAGGADGADRGNGAA